MAEIARHAGVGNATVFRHFPTKRDLVVALVEVQMGDMLAFAEEAVAAADPVGGLRLLVDRMCQRFVENTASSR